ncbi:MAG: MBL fold metallo-hydrolase [Gemmatimonadota bacterium]
MRYLGVGGWLLEWNGVQILTAPFYSNPSATRVAFGRIESDTSRVDALLPDVSGVEAILVGHAHYDHLMDVPFIANRRARGATVYANRTARNILAPVVDPARVHAVNADAGTPEVPGRWLALAGGRARVMAIQTLHAPHFPKVELFEGTVDTPLAELPETAEGWKGGVAYAFLIDFLDAQGGVAYRIHYQDLASTEPWGSIPDDVLKDGVPVDVAIVCPPSFDHVRRYPESIVENAQPRHVFLGHWEDFFDPPSEAPRSVPLTDLDEFVRRLERVLPAGSSWSLPYPGERFNVP